MPTVSHRKREVLLKIVYYGPGLGGKTTNLEYIHAHSRPEHRGKLLSLTSDNERTLFFDLLPIDLGEFKGYTIRLHLCTVPGQLAFDRTRRLILRGVDGVVFVVDSQPAQIDANVVSLENLATNLRVLGMDPDHIPVVVQYNKRDIDGVLETSELKFVLGIPQGVQELEASAKYGEGVFDTLKAIVRECLKIVGDPRRAPEGRTASILPGRRASMYPGALVGSATRNRAASEATSAPENRNPAEPDYAEVPRAPRVPAMRGSAGGEGGR